MTRREKLLSGLDVTHLRGIEIGPLMSPVISKNESEIYYVDHADRETLQSRYLQDPNVNPEQIVTVDVVWRDRTLRECFPDGRQFDYVIASHVIEHVPDMVGWMREIAEVLKPGGRFMLAIPDKRFTFDYLRVPTRLSEVVDAYLRRIRHPSPGQIFDYSANTVELDLIAAWENRVEPASLKRRVSLRSALERTVEFTQDGRVGHCWVFTARSFIGILADLVDLDLLPYTCVNLYEPERNTNEFIVVLERSVEESIVQKEDARASFLLHLHRLEEAEAEDIAALRKRIQILESEIATLVSSRSFRITQPLRRFASLLRNSRKRGAVSGAPPQC